MRIELGDIVAFDATGRFSLGTMTATTVMAGNLYRLTVTADEAFLTDENTVYPVSIDPTLTISDNTHGAGAIEDVSIYSGAPNANGNWTYLHSGYYDSTYKVARTLVRLKDLVSKLSDLSITHDRVTSAYFHIKEATGSAGIPVYLYANRGNAAWKEASVTWSNAGISLGTRYATASPAYGAHASYNITDLMKAWLNDEIEDPTAGFVLVSSNETSVDKAFHSSEYATASYRPYVVVNYSTDITLSKYTLDLDVATTYTLTATTTPPGQTITWSSSNTSVATVSSTGTIQAKTIGQTTITATASDGSSAFCIVYVTLSDGIYYISNVDTPSLVAGTSGNITDLTNVSAITKVTSGNSRYYQLWKVAHVQAGSYTIRPINKLDMALSVTGSNVDIKQIGSSNQPNDVPDHAKWTISFGTVGYVIRHSGSTSSAMKVPSSGVTNGSNISVGYYTSALPGFTWTFTPVTSVPGRVFLYDKSTGEEASGDKRYVPLGCTLTLDALDLELYIFTSTGSNTQSGRWTSGTPTVVSATTAGTITSKAGGSATITATSSYVENTVYFTVVCVPSGLTLDVVYDNGYLRRYSTDAVSRINTEISALREFYIEQLGVWINIGSPTLTYSLADYCYSTEIDEGCNCNDESGCNNSGIDAQTSELVIQQIHHKNLYNIAMDTRPDNSQNKKVIYTGHGTCSIRANGSHKSNLLDDGSHLYGITFTPLGIMGIAYNDSLDREAQTTIHEANHLFFDLDDHYTEDMQEGSPFKDDCIHGSNKDTLSSLMICYGCRQTIEAYLESIS